MKRNANYWLRRLPNYIGLTVLSGTLGLSCFYFWYEFLRSQLWGDQAYLMYAAGQLLRGASLDGAKLLETNPPLAVWFSAVPVALSRLLHIRPSLGLRLVTFAVLLGMFAWSCRLLARNGIFQAWSAPIWASAVWLTLLLVQPTFFGQREHFVVLLLLPYVVARGLHLDRVVRTWEQVLIGCAAGLAVCFKPQHILALAALELFLCLLNRSTRRLIDACPLSAACTILFYLVCARLFVPLYFTSVIPELLDTYWAFGTHSLSNMFYTTARGLTAAIVCGWFLWLGLRKKLESASLIGSLLACGSGAGLAYDLQHAGWSYQEIPAAHFLTLAAALAVLDFVSKYVPAGMPPRPVVRTFFRVSSASVLVLSLMAILFPNARVRSASTIDGQLQSYPTGTTVYAFSTQMSNFSIIEDRDLRWGSRFAHLWLLPAIVQNEVRREDHTRPFKALSAERTSTLAVEQRKEVADDLRQRRPKYIFVQRCLTVADCESFNAPMDYINWFSQDPSFAAEWSCYALSKHLEEYDLYIRSGA